VAVNDPFVMAAWGESTGAAEAGIVMLADPASDFTKAAGLNFTAPPVGFYDRAQRCAMVVEGGTVTMINVEDNPGTCNLSAGETILDAL
jgi:cytochrome c peroxidase